MKTIFLLLGLSLYGMLSYSQTLHKGSLVGVHVIVPDLKEGVRMQDFADFLKNKWLPEINKIFPDLKGYLVKSVRGQDSTSFGIIFIANSESDRNKYWTNDNLLTTSAQARFNKLMERLGKELDSYLATPFETGKYNDWVFQ